MANLFESIIKSPFSIPTYQPNVQKAPLNFQQSQPTQKIQQAPVESSIIPQASAWEPLVSDVEIEQMIKAGATDDEIVTIVQQLEQERSRKTQAPQPEQSFWEKTMQRLKWFWETMQNLVGGFVSEVPKQVGNIAEYGAKAWQYNPINLWLTAIKAGFSDKTYGQLREEQKKETEKFSEFWKKWSEFVKKYGAYNPESTSAKVGQLWANIAATAIWPWKFFKTVDEANKAIKILAAIGNTSIEWTTAAVSNYIANEGRLPTAKEIAEFIAIQWWAKVIWEVAWQVKKLPSARLIPTTITEAWKDIRKWIDIWEAISKTWISFTKWQLAKKIQEKITWLSNTIGKSIDKAIEATWPNNVTISGITKWLKDSLLKDKEIARQLQWTPIQRQQIEEAIDETIIAYKKLYWAKKLDLKAQQEMKQEIYTGLQNVFNKNLQTSKLTASQVTEKAIAKRLKEWLEEKVPWIWAINKELAPFLEANKRLQAKWWYSGYLTDILAWWFAWWSPTWILQDPVEYMKNFVTWVLVKRIGTSTFAKTSASTLMRKTEELFKNPQFQKYILEEARRLQSNQE